MTPADFRSKPEIAAETRARGARNTAEKVEAEKTAATLSAVTLTIPGKAGDEGKLFGSVTAQDVAEALGLLGVPAVVPRMRLLDTAEGQLVLAGLRLWVDPRDALAAAELAHLVVYAADLDGLDFLETLPGEEPRTELVRFRTVGDATCTGCVESDAADNAAVVAEVAGTRVTERGATRADDRLSEAAMEDRKKEGYF